MKHERHNVFGGQTDSEIGDVAQTRVYISLHNHPFALSASSSKPQLKSGG